MKNNSKKTYKYKTFHQEQHEKLFNRKKNNFWSRRTTMHKEEGCMKNNKQKVKKINFQ